MKEFILLGSTNSKYKMNGKSSIGSNRRQVELKHVNSR